MSGGTAPHFEEASAAVVRHLETGRFDLVRAESLGMSDDREMARVPRAKILEPTRRVDVPEADVLFISCTALAESLGAGRPVTVEELPSLADSLGGGIGLDNQVTFAMARDLVDDVALLNEPEIGLPSTSG